MAYPEWGHDATMANVRKKMLVQKSAMRRLNPLLLAVLILASAGARAMVDKVRRWRARHVEAHDVPHATAVGRGRPRPLRATCGLTHGHVWSQDDRAAALVLVAAGERARLASQQGARRRGMRTPIHKRPPRPFPPPPLPSPPFPHPHP